MIISHALNTAKKLLLIIAPLIFVSGCATMAEPGSPASQAANIQAEPTPDRLVRYCRRMAETKNLRIAIGICERALTTAPENPEPVIILAEAYLEAEHRAEAAEAYRFALSIDGQSGKAHFGLGKLYLRDSRLEEARPHLEAALRNGEQDPAIFNALGILEDQSGDHASAQIFYQAGLELDPDNTALANNLGVSLVLSKPSEIGNSIFGHLPPEQNLAERPQPAKTADPNQVPAKTLTKRISAGGQLTKPAASTVKKTIISAVSVPRLIQTPEESLLSFFRDSRAIDPNTMDPVITPAPVEIVNFQALPSLPAQPVIQVKESDGQATRLARALLDYDPAPVSITEPSLVTAIAPEKAHRDDAAARPSIDLATVTPGRNPLFKSKMQRVFGLNRSSTPVDTAAPSSARTIQIAEVPHLPIEMPRFDNAPRLDEQNAVTPHNEAPPEKQAESPLTADLHVIEVGNPLQATTPNQAASPKIESISSDIITDVILPSAARGLPLLQYDHEIWKTTGSGQDGSNQFAIHHDGLAEPGQSGAQGAEPDARDPDAEPLLWPNGLADRNLPLNWRPSPERPKDRILAMMLLNRIVISTA